MNLNFINYIFTGFIVVVCLVMSYFALFTNVFVKMHKNERLVLSLVLLTYAAFRVYRMVRTIQREKSNTDDL